MDAVAFIPRKLSSASRRELARNLLSKLLRGGFWTEPRGSIFFAEATSMEAIFMSVWMGASMKASMNFTRNRLPGFGCFRRICPSNVRTFGKNGSRVEVALIVPRPHRHPQGMKILQPKVPESRILGLRPLTKYGRFHERTIRVTK